MFRKITKELNLDKINPGAGIGNEVITYEKNLVKIDSINPSDESVIASVYACNQSHYDLLVKSSIEAFQSWREYPAPKRGEIIREIGNILRDKKSSLAQLISMEMGKSYQESLGEVQEMIDMADLAVGQSRMLFGKTLHSERRMHRMFEQWHPYGVVGIITAFNFPVAVWAWNAFLSAICGNISIWKPSSKTALCAIAVHKLCVEVLSKYKAPNIFGYFIPENYAIINNFLGDSRISLISFTGSTRTGTIVAEKVSKRLGKIILELGGNNAVIIDKTANLINAVRTIIFGAIGTAGQRCTTTRRVFVHKENFTPVLKELISAYHQLKIGNPLEEKNHMGPLIDKKAVDSYVKSIDEIKHAGGRVEFGGKLIGGKGYFVEPTIISGISNSHPIVQRETFAPILYVMSFDSIQEAIKLQNEVKQGLSSSLFSQDLFNAELFLSAFGSDCGIANVNIGTSGAEIGGAFGGEKDTGGGREAGSDAWKSYMRRQTCTINWGNELPLAQGIDFKI